MRREEVKDRSRRIYRGRITEAQRSATENAYMASLRQRPDSTVQPAPNRQTVLLPTYPTAYPKKQGHPLLIVGLILLFIMGIFACLALNNTHTEVPVTVITPTPTLDTGLVCSDQGCKSIYSDVPTYSVGSGSVIECRDGTYSHAGGRRGACSYHGGENRP